jgi:hypothetical protein
MATVTAVPTYAVVTKTRATEVERAVASGRVGGYVIADDLGTSILFDAPRRRWLTARALELPARHLVRRTGHPAWVLLAAADVAEAILVTPRDRFRLAWEAGWEPASDPAEYVIERTEWDAVCQRIADAWGHPAAGPRLATVRNDPVPGRTPPPPADLLRRLCAVFDLPDGAVGRSLLAHPQPGLFGARRVEARSRRWAF